MSGKKSVMDSKEKLQRYRQITAQLKSVIGKTDDLIAVMATIAAILYRSMDTFFWVGFYRLIEGRLIIGPYQGTLACQTLPKGKGVCWAAVKQKQTVIVQDVRKFQTHITCDERSKSEIVVPCLDTVGQIIAVLDVDSDKMAAFDWVDAEKLEKIVKFLCR